MDGELLYLYSLGELNDSDVEDVLLYEMASFRADIRIRSDQYDRFDLDALTPQECRQLFRFEKDDIVMLEAQLGISARVRTEARYQVTGLEALCIYLRRLTYPNRLSDLESLFGLSAPYSSVIVNRTMEIIEENYGHLLWNLENIPYWSEEKLQQFSEAIASRSAPLLNCWGFIDGTAREICRPSILQQEYYSRHKHKHCLKYQGVLTPDGITVHLAGPYPGRRHDAGVLQETNLLADLAQHAVFGNNIYTLYGDTAYPISDLICKPYTGNLTDNQQAFNTTMSSLRTAVEWGFGKVAIEFAFIDF